MIKTLEILKNVIKAVEHSEKGEFESAIKYLDEALTLDPKNELVLFIKGVILKIMGDMENSMKYFEEIESSKESSPLSWANLICLNFVKGDYQKTLEYTDKLSKVSSNCHLSPFHKALIYIE